MVIDGTRFQAQKFLSAVNEYDGLREATEEGEKISPAYLPLLSDTFSAFFQNKARIKTNPPAELEQNRQIIETVLGLREYEELHTVSRLDFFASAAATRAFSDELIELIKKKKKEQQRENRGKENEQQPFGIDSDTLRWAVRKSLRKGLEEAHEAKQAVESFGREEGGLKRIPITEQFRLADLLSKNGKVKEIIRMLGRIRLEALSVKRSKVTHSTPVRRGVETTGLEGIDRILPEELADLALGKSGEKRFLRKLSDEELLAYSYKNPVEESHGPILVAVDGSGSMQGSREIWAKALAIAAFLQAKKEKRKARGIIFGASEREIFEIETNKLEELASACFEMGTSFEYPLNWAEKKFVENPKADFLFITDGICDLSSDRRASFIATKARTGAKCYSVLIGSELTETVKQFSDRAFSLPTTPGAKHGGHILAEI
jgi:uncharacterized protein with von Willebrand factor type A (vWA) domain